MAHEPPKPAAVREMRKELGMTPAELGAALRLSTEDPAGAVRRWEAGQEPVPGPAALALAYLTQGALDDTMKEVFPEYVFATSLPDPYTHTDLVIRLWRPRFVGVIAGRVVDGLDGIRGDVEALSVAMWIDDPAGFDTDALLRRAITAFDLYTFHLDVNAFDKPL